LLHVVIRHSALHKRNFGIVVVAIFASWLLSMAPRECQVVRELMILAV